MALAALLGALLFLLAGLALARRMASRRARARNRIAQRGEAEAVRLLEDAGYVVEGHLGRHGHAELRSARTGGTSRVPALRATRQAAP